MGERGYDSTTQSMASGDDAFGKDVIPGPGQRSRAMIDGGLSAVASAPVRDPQRYAILGEHGRGALGRVSRAHDKELGRDVAIKELIYRDARGEARFLREALITARLEHPGIVAVHEAGRWPDGTPFYAMKLVSGRPLRELMAERSTVEERIGLLHHVIAVADAIAYAHGRNVIHRDLKPSNVIVGEFGETVVIDWGLAKDLTATEHVISGGDLGASGGNLRASSDSELTMVGTVLGTPAYMAPEQERGDPVDCRADVYAIGVMLWELCAPSRVPPSQAQARHLMLRRAGIDDDLISILDKALDPAPARRYPNAGALANDLKAFKAGARVAARSYSPLAVLAHWTRRHRALTFSIVAVLVLAIAGCFAYVRNVAIERDRADAAKADARRARAASDTALEQLTLNHARLWLMTDPSAAVDALAGYHGTDRLRVEQIRAEAIGHGVAVLRAVPHTNTILWADGTADGAIVSLSTDGTIARTARDATSVVIARGVSQLGRPSYSRSRHLLAYTCDGAQLCLLDVLRAARIPTTGVLDGAHVAGLSFSPDGAQLAVLSQDAVLRVLDLADLTRPSVLLARPVPGGEFVKFVDESVVSVNGQTGVTLLRLNGDTKTFAFPGIVRWDASAPDHQLALAASSGQAVVLTGFPPRAEARAELCPGLIFDLRFIPGRQSLAYACRAGTVGIWDLQRGTVTPRVHLEGVAGNLATSADGDYVFATSGNGTVTVLDLATDLIASYKGHGHRLTSITRPSPEYPFLISGDAGGALRAWPLPVRVARVATRSTMPFNAAIFDPGSSSVTAASLAAGLTTYSPAEGARPLGPHDAYHPLLEASSSGKTFAAFGLHDLVEVWSSESRTRTRVVSTGHGSVSGLHFVSDDDFITSGHDGRLVRWRQSGEHQVITQFPQPIHGFIHASSAAGHVMVVSTADGALWRTDDAGHTQPLRSGGAGVTQLVASANRRTVYAGYADGQVIGIDTTSWQQTTLLRGRRAVQAIDVTSDGRTLAVVTDDGAIHVNTHGQAGGMPAGATWVTLVARARHVALAPDGLVIAACADGTIWLYFPTAQRWRSLVIEGADLDRSVVAPDGKAAVALDRGARLVWIDLQSARQLLDTTDQDHKPQTGTREEQR